MAVMHRYMMTGQRLIEGVGPMRLNLGCGDYAMEHYINVDQTFAPGVDIVMTVPPLPWPDESIVEIYCGHFLEHLDRPQANHLLQECRRILEPGGKLGIVVPDFFEIARRYVEGTDMPFEWPAGSFHDLRDLDELNHYLLFSTCQPSHHQWMYDMASLERALNRAGFDVTGEIDRYTDPRLSTPRWYQFGLEATRR